MESNLTDTTTKPVLDIQDLAKAFDDSSDSTREQLKLALQQLGQQNAHLFIELAAARKNKEYHKEPALVNSIIKTVAKILPEFMKMRFDSIHDGNLYLENGENGGLSKENLNSFVAYFGVENLMPAEDLKYFAPNFDRGYETISSVSQPEATTESDESQQLREFGKTNEVPIKTIYKYKRAINIQALQENIDHLFKAASEDPKVAKNFQDISEIILDADGVNIKLKKGNNLLQTISLTNFLEQFGGLEIIGESENKGAPEIKEILDKPYRKMPIKELRYEFGQAQKPLIISIYEDKKKFKEGGLQENFDNFIKELKEKKLNYLLTEESDLHSSSDFQFYDQVIIKEAGAKLDLVEDEQAIATFSISEFLEKFGGLDLLVDVTKQGQTEIRSILDSSYRKLRGYHIFLSVKGAIITGLTAVVLAALSGQADNIFQIVMKYIYKLIAYYK